MTKSQAETASGIALLREVFGLREGQKLTEFVEECKPIRDDEKFMAEVRAYAIEHAEKVA